MSLPAPKRKREKFLPEEDIKLRELVAIHGPNAWEIVAAGLPGRNVRQCRERWKHYLSSDRLNAAWTPDEDRLLFEKIGSIGPKWTRLATFFPGRTDIQVKARWMQTFAHMSDLHVKNRPKRIQFLTPPAAPAPPLEPTSPIQFIASEQKPPPAVQMVPPKPPTPQKECECLYSFGRDSSFGSRSFLDFSPWNE
jgi:hypothetical protein